MSRTRFPLPACVVFVTVALHLAVTPATAQVGTWNLQGLVTVKIRTFNPNCEPSVQRTRRLQRTLVVADDQTYSLTGGRALCGNKRVFGEEDGTWMPTANPRAPFRFRTSYTPELKTSLENVVRSCLGLPTTITRIDGGFSARLTRSGQLRGSALLSVSGAFVVPRPSPDGGALPDFCLFVLSARGSFRGTPAGAQ